MEEAVEGGRGRWSTAVGLTVVVLLLTVLDGLVLVLIPLALLLIALPGERKAWWVFCGLAIWLAVLVLSGGALAMLSRSWGVVTGVVFLAVTLGRPDWSVTGRSLAAVAMALGVALIVLIGSGEVAALDALMTEHLTALSATFIEIQERLPEAARPVDPEAAAARMVEIRSQLFPALLGLQSVGALALAAWWVRKLGRSDRQEFVLGRMRDFRFSDQLIWVLITGIALVLLPAAAGVGLERLGLNLIVFMVGLYVLRGLAVFAFLAAGTRSVAAIVFGVLAVLLLQPVVFTAALMMGVGDTWLDVRRKLTPASPA